MSSRTDNCFDEVRFILAFIVLVAHTSALATAEQLHWFTKYFDSDFAVKGFFSISGYLVTRSYVMSNSTVLYFEKRMRRVYPAYILVILYCLLVGFITSDLSLTSFVKDVNFFRYLVANLAFLNFIQPNLPGAIPYAEVQALNGSLWTIKVELMLYLTVPFLVSLHNRVGLYSTLFISFSFGIAWYLYFSQYFYQPMGEMISRQFPGQLPFFAFGSMLGFTRLHKLSLLGALLVGSVYFAIISVYIDNPLREVINMVIYPPLIVTVANSRVFSINLAKYGDLSYGIYLFHFPTIQVLEHFGLYKFNPYFAFFISICLIILFALFSWHLVEKRFLKRSSH